VTAVSASQEAEARRIALAQASLGNIRRKIKIMKSQNKAKNFPPYAFPTL
jgi:hypothetical protein